MVEGKGAANNEETEWIPGDYNLELETSWEKLKRKCVETPFVPVGLIATIGALSYGIYNFYSNKSKMQQYCMRARVTFQGFTLAAILWSMYQEGQKRMNLKEQKS